MTDEFSLHHRAGGTRGAGFTREEVQHLLDIVSETKPRHAEEWEHVATRHRVAYPSTRRTAESLRRKYHSLCRAKGVLDGAKEVREAKRIRLLISEGTPEPRYEARDHVDTTTAVMEVEEVNVAQGESHPPQRNGEYDLQKVVENGASVTPVSQNRIQHDTSGPVPPQQSIAPEATSMPFIPRESVPVSGGVVGVGTPPALAPHGPVHAPRDGTSAETLRFFLSQLAAEREEERRRLEREEARLEEERQRIMEQMSEERNRFEQQLCEERRRHEQLMQEERERHEQQMREERERHEQQMNDERTRRDKEREIDLQRLQYERETERERRQQDQALREEARQKYEAERQEDARWREAATAQQDKLLETLRALMQSKTNK